MLCWYYCSCCYYLSVNAHFRDSKLKIVIAFTAAVVVDLQTPISTSYLQVTIKSMNHHLLGLFTAGLRRNFVFFLQRQLKHLIDHLNHYQICVYHIRNNSCLILCYP